MTSTHNRSADVGFELSPWSLTSVDPEKMKVLALLLADPNPIHFDASAALLATGSDRTVNQGPSSIAMLYNLIHINYPGCHVRTLRARLAGNVLADDDVVATGVVSSVTADANGTVVVVDVQLAAGGRERVVTGTAEIVIAGR